MLAALVAGHQAEKRANRIAEGFEHPGQISGRGRRSTVPEPAGSNTTSGRLLVRHLSILTDVESAVK